MTKTTTPARIALLALIPLSLWSAPALAQTQASPNQLAQSAVNAEALAALPDQIEQQVSDALMSADYATISAAINEIVTANPGLSVDIAASAARALPAAAAVIVSSAISAIMTADPTASDLVMKMSAAVADAAPAYAAQIAVAVMQALPAGLQGTASRNLVMNAVANAANPSNPGATMADITRALAIAQASAPSGLTTSIVPQAPVSGT